MSNGQLLEELILRLSKSRAIVEAAREWYVEERGTGIASCEACGHRIKHTATICNGLTRARAVIGSTCLDYFWELQRRGRVAQAPRTGEPFHSAKRHFSSRYESVVTSVPFENWKNWLLRRLESGLISDAGVRQTAQELRKSGQVREPERLLACARYHDRTREFPISALGSSEWLRKEDVRPRTKLTLYAAAAIVRLKTAKHVHAISVLDGQSCWETWLLAELIEVVGASSAVGREKALAVEAHPDNRQYADMIWAELRGLHTLGCFMVGDLVWASGEGFGFVTEVCGAECSIGHSVVRWYRDAATCRLSNSRLLNLSLWRTFVCMDVVPARNHAYVALGRSSPTSTPKARLVGRRVKAYPAWLALDKARADLGDQMRRRCYRCFSELTTGIRDHELCLRCEAEATAARRFHGWPWETMCRGCRKTIKFHRGLPPYCSECMQLELIGPYIHPDVLSRLIAPVPPAQAPKPEGDRPGGKQRKAKRVRPARAKHSSRKA